MTYAKATLNVKLTVTWQVHCVTANFATFLSGHGRGMSDVSEQVGESAHHSMKPMLQWHRKARAHPDHGTMQMNAIVKYNSWKCSTSVATARQES